MLFMHVCIQCAFVLWRSYGSHENHFVLQLWQKSLGSSANDGSAAPAKGKQDTAAPQERKEFGADLEFHFSRLQARPDEAELDSLAHYNRMNASGSTCAP